MCSSIEKVVKKQHSGLKTCACSLAGAQHHVAPNSKHPGTNPSLNLNQFNYSATCAREIVEDINYIIIKLIVLETIMLCDFLTE